MMWGESLFGPNTCRLCAGTGEVCVPIVSKDGDSQLLHKIKRCIPISLSEDDDKPKQLCYSCVSKLEVCHGLIENSLAAEFKFDSIIQSSYTGSLQQDKVLIIQGDGKGHHLEHTLGVDTMMELRSSADGIWQPVKNDHLQAVSQGTSIDASSAPTTVTVEHVQVHTEQLSSDSVIVLSKVEARGDGRPGEGLVAGGVANEDGSCPDILLMVELKYKEVLGEGSSKVPTITYATADPTAALEHFKEEHQVVQLIAQTHHAPSASQSSPRKGERTNDGANTSQKKFQCDVCQKFFMRRANLNSHLALHSNIRPFSCDICIKTFCSKWDLTLHKRLHSKDFSCDFCDKAFSVKGKLERHRRVHTGEKPYVCSHCPKAFSDKRNMQAHVRCHTGEKPYVCEICNRAFRSKSHLTDHKRVHTIEKTYICHICGKNFKWKNTLNMHLKYHAGEQYSCDTCGKNFSRRTDLKKHIVSHSVARPFTCESCGKNFKDANTLRKHSKGHTNDKPYSCYVCGKTFHFQWYLNSHMKIHKPLSCEQCGTVFPKKSGLLIHKKYCKVGNEFKCKYCTEEFDTEESLALHTQHDHSPRKPTMCQ